MSNCDHIDSLVTPYIDGELAGDDRSLVEQHLQMCGPCRARVETEQSVCHLLRLRKSELRQAGAPAGLRARIQPPAPPRVVPFPVVASTAPPAAPVAATPRRVGYRRLAIAATLLLGLGGAITYRATVGATRAIAAELTADHVKCFMVNNVLHPHESVAEVEAYMRTGFDWEATLPQPAPAPHDDLEVIGSRPCFYEHGKVAHIMYHHKGLPVSIFMLPGIEYERNLVHTMGHDAVVWAADGRTFVLIAKAPRAEVERIAAVVQASLR